MKNHEVRSMIEQRVHLENKIKALGGTLPKKWIWDVDNDLRNLQLIELLEDLEKKENT